MKIEINYLPTIFPKDKPHINLVVVKWLDKEIGKGWIEDKNKELVAKRYQKENRPQTFIENHQFPIKEIIKAIQKYIELKEKYNLPEYQISLEIYYD